MFATTFRLCLLLNFRPNCSAVPPVQKLLQWKCSNLTSRSSRSMLNHSTKWDEDDFSQVGKNLTAKHRQPVNALCAANKRVNLADTDTIQTSLVFTCWSFRHHNLSVKRSTYTLDWSDVEETSSGTFLTIPRWQGGRNLSLQLIKPTIPMCNLPFINSISALTCCRSEFNAFAATITMIMTDHNKIQHI